MISTPDRSGPDLSKYADSAVDTTPTYPFFYSPKNGFANFTQVQYTPGVVRHEFVLRGLTHPGTKPARIVAACAARLILITELGISRYTTDFGTHAETVAYSPVPKYNENEQYIMRLEATDANNLVVKIFKMSGDLLTSATLTETALFSGNPTFAFGFPTDAQIANDGNNTTVYQPYTGLELITTQIENPGPTAVALSPAATKTTADVGYWVGTLTAAHARVAALPCTYALVAGTGDTNNALFSVRGSQLHVAGTITSGSKSVRVEAMDRYGKTYAAAITITVS